MSYALLKFLVAKKSNDELADFEGENIDATAETSTLRLLATDDEADPEPVADDD